MKAIDHPEFDLYRRDRLLVERCRQAVAAWRRSGEPLPGPEVDGEGPPWAPQRAQEFVREVARLFQAYNRVLWQQFSYCRTCRGGCCVVGAAQVTRFDALALALLEEPFPQEPQRAGAGDCIYLTSGGCSWPAAWRPLKCWAFYCLGSGDWELDAADERYGRITQALESVLEAHLPRWLQAHERENGSSFLSLLTDPITFAEKLGAALMEIFVAPFEQHFPSGAGGEARGPRPGSGDRLLAFIAEAVEEVWVTQPPAPRPLEITAQQFLGDLETLEWCLLGHPQGWQERLQVLERRYAAAPAPAAGQPPSLWYRMGRNVALLRQEMMDRPDTRG